MAENEIEKPAAKMQKVRMVRRHESDGIVIAQGTVIELSEQLAKKLIRDGDAEKIEGRGK